MALARKALFGAIAVLSAISCDSNDSDEGDVPFVSNGTGSNFLFVATRGNTVSGYSIDSSTGALREVRGSPFATKGYPPVDVHIDGAGKFLFVEGSSGGAAPQSSLTGYAIDPDTGALTQVSEIPMTNQFARSRAAVFQPNDGALYIPTLTDGLHAYAIDRTNGALSSVPGMPYHFPHNAVPEKGVFDPSGLTMFIASHRDGTPAQVSAFAVDATTGALTLQTSTSYSGGAGPMIAHPGGRFAYMWRLPVLSG